ncbi:sporadically distributed protein, TIGR04141 family [Lentzea albidocapillata subsp. violacea]|uniref:Sporadically distributed protein, TIGR04141 family n=1 Tax=Lentzea albidocapillata subsp. violacea TaxID=128104 RepID=A0A1G9XSJ4_9PSEU|nr:sporadically distributed protein, TIGR04141 family [Lentzea albidocapillata subsp. violacea]
MEPEHLAEEELAAPSAETRKVSLYQLTGSGDLRECVALKALEEDNEFEIDEVRVGDQTGLLVHGWSEPEEVGWNSMVRTLTGVDLRYERTVASAAVFVEVDEVIYVVTFNQGWRLVRDSRVNRSFGIDFAVRVVDDDEIQQITRWALSSKSRIDRNAVPSGQGLWSFGLREHAELVRELVAKARADLPVSLTHMRPKAHRRNPRLRLECRDGLKLPLSVEGSGLISDLREINKVLAECPVVEALAPLQWVKRVPAGDERRERLELAVAELLAGEVPSGEVGISYPAKYFDGPDVHRYRGTINGTKIDTDDLTLDHIALPLRSTPAESRLHCLRTGYIDGYDEHGKKSSDGMAALQWIAAEVDLEKGRHILLDGEWFVLGEQYVAHVDSVVRKAFASPPPWKLPAWNLAPPNDEGKIHEGAYNAYVAEKNSGRFICLDKKLVTTRAHPRGFEACDLLGPGDALVHVKKTSSNTGSSPLSHLFAQGLVAAESFTDAATWEKFRQLVALQDKKRARKMGRRPGSVVFAIHRSDKTLTAETLFTFARSTLVSAWNTLSTYGIPVHIAVID